MRALNRVFRAKTINTQRRGVAFSIRQLFANSEPGVWYDPSDFSTLFQDAAGTTPVTTVEQPVGLMLDKSKGLVLGPELVTNGTFDTNTSGWGALFGGSLTVSNYALRITNTIANGGAARQTIGVTPGKTYLIRYSVVTTSPYSRMTIESTAGGRDYVLINHNSKNNFTRLITATSTVLSLQPGSGSGVVGDYAEFDNISVRELPGNHAYQTTATSRPVLSARYNLLTKTEQFDDAAWTKVRSNITQNAAVAPDGTFTADKWIEDTTTADNHLIYGTLAAFTADVSYTLSLYAKAAERSFIQLTTGLAVGGETRWANFNLSNGTIGSFGADATPSITAVGNGWFHCQIVFISSTTAIENLTAALVTSATAERLEAYTGDGTSGIYIWGASLVPTNQSSLPYQRVNTDTDYDADPAKFPAYLRFDGVDDFLVTPTITPGTDKVQVFAGVRKLSDAARGIVVEQGDLLVRGVNLNAPDSAASNFSIRSYTANLSGVPVASGYPAPTTNVVTGLADISGDSAIIRINGAQAAQSTSDQGTGNYLAHPLYIGSRAGTSLPFNGHLYSLIVCFGPNLPIATIEKTEKYINGLTKAY